MNIQEEIHRAISEIESKLQKNIALKPNDYKTLLLTSLLEEEGSNE